MTPQPCTRWEIVAVPGHPILSVELVVDTTAQDVIDTIERAARGHGIRMQRVFEETEEDEARCINCRQLLEPGEDCGHQRHSWCCLIHSEAS